MEAYWLRRAEGGVGCIIVDATSVDPSVPYLGNTLCFRSEESIQKYKHFTDKVHQYGCKIIPQITHPGPESVSAFYGVAPVASSVYPNSMGQMTRELAIEELPGIVDLYVKASLDAQRAGFDGIELHCAHAYMLLGSFLSPLRNKRTDAYGGSLLNRARLLFEVIDGIKEACGKDFPIILRMSGSEKDPQGNTLEDMKRLIPYLEKHGVDCFEISGGTQYERCNKIIPCHGEAEFTNLEEAKAIKSVATKPVITVGKILDARLAEDVLDAGEVDGVVIGRALLAEPDFVKKAEEAYKAMKEIAETGKPVLFVGTKKQAQEAIKEEAERCGMYYVNQRWLGGMMTNFKTIESRIARLKKIKEMEEDGTFDVLPKREVLELNKEKDKLQKNLGGIEEMGGLPDMIFVVDPKKESICVQEAHTLGIPLVGIADTNSDPEELDYIIPGNDDAIRAVKLITSAMADAVIEANQGIDADSEEVAEDAE